MPIKTSFKWPINSSPSFPPFYVFFFFFYMQTMPSTIKAELYNDKCDGRLDSQVVFTLDI